MGHEEVLWALLTRGGRSQPGGLTREELCGELGYSASFLSPILRQAEVRGWVRGVRSHVTGRRYRLKVYQVTPAGREHLDRMAIPSPGPLPAPPAPFVGRAQELAELGRALAAGGVVVVDGVPGVGKTGLVRRALRHTWRTHASVWTTVGPGNPAGGLLETVGQVLRRGGWVGQDDPQLKMPASWSPVDVLLLMGRSPQRLLWVVDDVQNASGSTLEVLRAMLAGFANGGRHTAVLITQREIPWPIPGGTRLHLSVRGLPRKDALELVQALGLPEERFEAVYRATLGNPRYLRLSAQQGGMSEDVPFADHVLSSLAPAQRRALLPVALSWEGLRPKELLALGLGPQEVRNLVSVSVLETTEAGLRMADPLARRLPELAPWEEVRSAHGALVDAVPRLLPAERFCHLVDAERTREALRILTSGSPLWEGGASARVYPHLLRLAYHLPPGRARGRVFWILAQFQRRQEDFVTASGFLERALEDLPPDDPLATLSAAALSMTVLRTGHLGLARRWARRLAGFTPLPRWSSVRDLIHGNLLISSRRFPQARRLIRRAAAQGRLHRNWEVVFMALKGEAYVALQMGEPEASLDACLKGLMLARRRGRPDLIRYFRLEANLARLRLGRLDEAEQEYDQLLEEVRREHARGHLAVLLLGLAHIAGRRGDLSKAEALTREAVSEAEALMDPTLTSRAYGSLAEWLRRQHKREAARRVAQRAMELSRSSGTNLGLPWALEVWDLVRQDSRDLGGSRSTKEPPGVPRGMILWDSQEQSHKSAPQGEKPTKE
jgi:hypothetical protein